MTEKDLINSLKYFNWSYSDDNKQFIVKYEDFKILLNKVNPVWFYNELNFHLIKAYLNELQLLKNGKVYFSNLNLLEELIYYFNFKRLVKDYTITKGYKFGKKIIGVENIKNFFNGLKEYIESDVNIIYDNVDENYFLSFKNIYNISIKFTEQKNINYQYMKLL